MLDYGWMDYVSTLGPTVVALVAAIIVVVGWFVKSHRELNNEIEKEVRQYRIEMCHSIIRFHKYFRDLNRDKQGIDVQDIKQLELFEEMQSNVLLYGGTIENELLKSLSGSFRIAAENIGAKNEAEALAHYNISNMANKLFSISVKILRRELRLEKISKRKLEKGTER